MSKLTTTVQSKTDDHDFQSNGMVRFCQCRGCQVGRSHVKYYVVQVGIYVSEVESTLLVGKYSRPSLLE